MAVQLVGETGGLVARPRAASDFDDHAFLILEAHMGQVSYTRIGDIDLVSILVPALDDFRAFSIAEGLIQIRFLIEGYEHMLRILIADGKPAEFIDIVIRQIDADLTLFSILVRETEFQFVLAHHVSSFRY